MECITGKKENLKYLKRLLITNLVVKEILLKGSKRLYKGLHITYLRKDSNWFLILLIARMCSNWCTMLSKKPSSNVSLPPLLNQANIMGGDSNVAAHLVVE